MSNKRKLISFKRPESWQECKKLISAHPVYAFCVIAGIVCVVLWLFGGGSDKQLSPHPKHKPVIEGVKEAVDPRATWSESLTQDVQALRQDINQKQTEQAQATQSELKRFTDELQLLKNNLDSIEQERQASLAAQVQEEEIVEKKPAPRMGFIHKDYEVKKQKNPEKYVTSGSFARAVLLTGVVADTGTDASGAPQPILLRLVDKGIFSKGYTTEQIKEAIIIGSCYGNISSERALCRLEKLSLVNQQQQIVERPVEGWLIGEDGRPGLKGDVVDKSSDVSRMAILNGILGGIAGFLQNQATAGVYPVSPITGQSKALAGVDSLKAGGAQGVGNALQKLADYAIKRAEQMSPVIVVGAGRVIDVVFKSGFELTDVTSINNSVVKPGISFGSNNSLADANEAGNTMGMPNKQTRTSGYQQGMKALNDLQMGQGVM